MIGDAQSPKWVWGLVAGLVLVNGALFAAGAQQEGSIAWYDVDARWMLPFLLMPAGAVAMVALDRVKQVRRRAYRLSTALAVLGLAYGVLWIQVPVANRVFDRSPEAVSCLQLVGKATPPGGDGQVLLVLSGDLQGRSSMITVPREKHGAFEPGIALTVRARDGLFGLPYITGLDASGIDDCRAGVKR